LKFGKNRHRFDQTAIGRDTACRVQKNRHRFDQTAIVSAKPPSVGQTAIGRSIPPSVGTRRAVSKKTAIVSTKPPSVGTRRAVSKQTAIGRSIPPSVGQYRHRFVNIAKSSRKNNGATVKSTVERTRHAVSLQGRRKNIGVCGLFICPPSFCMTRRSATIRLFSFGFFS
jgi:hypothetical protein